MITSIDEFFRSFSRLLLCIVLAGVLALAGCGGGGGDGGGGSGDDDNNDDSGDDDTGGGGDNDDDNTAGYEIGVIAQGLRDGNTITLIEGDQSLEVDENDSLFIFPETRPDGSAYQVQIDSAPANQACEVLDGEGEIRAADVTVTVNCQNGPPITAARVNHDRITLDWSDDEGLGAPDSYDVSWAEEPVGGAGIAATGDSAVDVSPPFVIDGLSLDRNWYLTVTAHYGDETRSSTVSRALSGLGFEGELRASQALDDGRIALGGEFAFTGLTSGALARLDRRDGQQLPFPAVDGTINALLEDDDGAIYVGGDFSLIGGVAQPGLARLLPDGSVDEDWRPDFNDAVHALAHFNGNLAVGGDFTAVGGDSGQAHLTVLDEDGQAMPAWSGLGLDGHVAVLAEFQGRLVAGGAFDNGGGPYLAAFNEDGEVQATPTPDAAVQTLLAWDGQLFIGGYFEQVDGNPRSYLATLDDNLSLDDWALDIRSPDPEDYDDLPPVPRVGALARHDNQLLVGGVFGDVESQDRRNLVAIDLDGQVRDWNPAPSAGVEVIAPWDGEIIVGGQFNDIGRLDLDTARENYRLSRLALLGFDELDENGRPLASTRFPLGADGPVRAVLTRHDQVILGGDMNALGYWIQGASGLAFLDPNGRLDTGEEHLVTDGGIRDFTMIDGRLYAVGDFERFTHPDLGDHRQFAVRYGTDDAIDTGWSIARPEPGEVETALGVSPNLVLGGDFTEFLLQGQVDRLAALDANGDLAVGWRSGDGPDDRVNNLALVDDTVYAAGAFTMVQEGNDDLTRPGYAAFNSGDGALTGWSPTHGDHPGTLAGHEGELIIALEDGGNWSLGTVNLPGDDIDTDITSAEAIYGLTTGNAGLFVFGHFDQLSETGGNDYDRPGVARLRVETGTLSVDGFAPNMLEGIDGQPGMINTAFSVDGRICLAGDFDRVGESRRARLACFETDGTLSN